MKRLRSPEFALILGFLITIASAPIVQSVLEVRRGELPQALELFKRKPTARNLRSYERNLQDASWVAERLRPWVQYAQFSWLHDGGAKASLGRDGWLFYTPGLQYLTERPGLQKATSTASDAAAAIVSFRDQLSARDIRLLVVPAPNKESVYPEKLTRRAANLDKALGAETGELFDRLRTAQVEVVDLFELFATAKSTCLTSSPAFYLAKDSHWSPSGVELAAGAVAQRILKLGWAKSGSVEYEAKPIPVQRDGDILRMLQVPQLEREAVPEIVTCREIVRLDTREPYRDDSDSEILVLGDSFLRIYQQDEPGAAGFIAHLAKELRQPVTSIVNDGGASTLVRQELNRRPAWLAGKKLVIWEFVERDVRLGTEGWQAVALPSSTNATAGESREKQ
jgi:hypothetical protein